jgi:predicted hydrolase (HD superfamily)
MLLEKQKIRGIVNMISRDEAFNLLKKYNKDNFHIQHALTVEAVMKWYAVELGYGDNAEYWGIVGMLHDIDFELYPEEHLAHAPQFFADVETQGIRQVDVQQYQVKSFVCEYVKCGFAVGCECHSIALICEHVGYDHRQVRIVVDYQ